MEELAERIGMDPVAFKRLNWIKEGQDLPLAKAMGEGRGIRPDGAQRNGLEACFTTGSKAAG